MKPKSLYNIAKDEWFMNNPQFQQPQSEPPTQPPDRWAQFAYYFVIYIVLVGIVLIIYPRASKYTLPITSLIFPINESGSLMKNILVLSGMYWAGIFFSTFMLKKKS